MNKQKTLIVGLTATLFFVLFAGSCGEEKEDDLKGEILVKGIFDLTGGTMDVGVSYQKGVLDYIKTINETGGIKGYQIKMDWIDYAYVADNAVQQYDKWAQESDWGDVVTIFGWGTADSMILSPKVTEDKKPYVSASYADSIASPKDRTVTLEDGTQKVIKGAPYNFFAGTDYDTSIKLALSFAAKQGAKKVGFAFCSAAYCTEPIPAGKEQAKKDGVTILDDLKIELSYADDDGNPLNEEQTREKIDGIVKEYFEQNPEVHWIWIGNTRKTTAMIIESSVKYSRNTKFIANVWGFDELLDKACKDNACRGRAYGIMPFAAYGDTTNADEMIKLIEIHDAENPPDKFNDTRYVQGYVSVLVWQKAVQKILDAGKEITAEEIKASFETFANESTGGLTAPITFTPDNHRPNKQARIYSLDENGKLKFEASVSL